MKAKFFLIFIFTSLFIIPGAVNAQLMEKQMPRPTFYEQTHKNTASINQSFLAKDPLITEMVAAVSADTIEHTLRELQNWGSRYALNDNHKDVAVSLMQKFLSYGYTDVKLDSFLCIYFDTTFQYNVICNLRGVSAPNEVFMIAAHYDSHISTGDPIVLAPGIDDDGSGVAAVLEVARVMALSSYQPEATIQFTLFAAEELQMLGSIYDVAKAKQENKDIRLMMNMDMIGNNPDNLNKINGYLFRGSEWAAIQSAESIENYSGVHVEILDRTGSGRGDFGPYTAEGIPATSFEEVDFSPYYHLPGDTVGNCNIPFIATFTGGVLAALAEQVLKPTPQNAKAYSTKNDITLKWKPTNNAFIKNTTIYRSDSSGIQYQKIASIPATDSVYHDLTAEQNKQYFYVLATENDSLQESGFSDEVSGARYNFCDTLLVLANLKGTLTTPDSVFAFYQAVLDTIPFVWHDINSDHKISPALLSRYSTTLWISNNVDFEIPDNSFKQFASDYVTNKGNILYAGFYPLKFWSNTPVYSAKVPETELMNQIFKVDSVKITYNSMMFRANSVSSGYDTLNVDKVKYMNNLYPGQIYNIEGYAPTSEGKVIFRFDTKYSSSSNLGKMKNRPVGLEYMGNDFKSILLSFPLYYMDTIDAMEFLHFVMTQKFNNTNGIESLQTADPLDLYIYPNPFTTVSNMTFKLVESGKIKISLFSMQGQLLRTISDTHMQKGTQSLSFQTGDLAAGVYQILLQTGESQCVKKIVKL